MTAYRVAVSMLSPHAFPKTIEQRRAASPTQPLMLTFYHGDVVNGVLSEDVDRLVAEGYLEAVPERETEPA